MIYKSNLYNCEKASSESWYEVHHKKLKYEQYMKIGNFYEIWNDLNDTTWKHGIYTMMNYILSNCAERRLNCLFLNDHNSKNDEMDAP